MLINIFLCLQLSDTSQQSENLKADVARELSRIEDLNNNTQSSKDNVTGQQYMIITQLQWKITYFD